MSPLAAIVTGGTRGIGRATVRRLLRDGARVCFCGRDPEAGERAAAELAAHGDVLFVPCDVGREDDVRALVDACVERFGPPSVLVNNAGVNATYDAVEMTGAEWDAFFAVD